MGELQHTGLKKEIASLPTFQFYDSEDGELLMVCADISMEYNTLLRTEYVCTMFFAKMTEISSVVIMHGKKVWG